MNTTTLSAKTLKNEMVSVENTENKQWYTIEELAKLCGFTTETLKYGEMNLNAIMKKMSINIEVNTHLGGYHNTQKFYSENVLKALKQYQIRNSTPNTLKEKGIAIQGNVSFTINETIEKLMDNPETLNLILQKSLERNQKLGIENKQLKEIISEQKPKVDVYNRIADGKGCFTMNQAAKALKLPYGNVTLFRKLREMQLLNNDNSPKQEQTNNGNFRVVVKFVNNEVGNKSITLVTTKGLVYLSKRFNTEIDENVKTDA